MNAFQSYELRLGHKKVYGIEEPDGRVKCIVDCDECGPEGLFQVWVTKEQAEELFTHPRQRHIQDILPDMPPDHREIFIAGTTPMETEFMRGIELDPTLKRYGGHYVVDCPECGKPTSDMVLTPQGWLCRQCCTPTE